MSVLKPGVFAWVTDSSVFLINCGNRSFENNWNSYRMLAHVHLPESKVWKDARRGFYPDTDECECKIHSLTIISININRVIST